MHRLPGDGAVAEGNEEEARSRDQGESYMGSQGVPYMETVYGTKEEVVQGEDAPLRKGLMWLQKGKLFSRYECKVKETKPSCENLTYTLHMYVRTQTQTSAAAVSASRETR